MSLILLAGCFSVLMLIAIYRQRPFQPWPIYGLFAGTSVILDSLLNGKFRLLYMLRYFFYVTTGFIMTIIPFIILLLALLILMELGQEPLKQWGVWVRSIISVVILLGISGITTYGIVYFDQQQLNHLINSYSLVSMYFVVSFLFFIVMNEAIHYFPKPSPIKTLIVLGYAVSRHGKMSRALIRRLDKVVSIYQHMQAKGDPLPKIIVTGGIVGDYTSSEASVMYQYLLDKGIPQTQLVVEDQARNTDQNLNFSAQVISQKALQPPVMVVTNRFHLMRTKILAGYQGLQASYIGAGGPWHLWPYQILREYIAVMTMNKEWNTLYILCLIYIAMTQM